MEFNFRNVNDAFKILVGAIHCKEIDCIREPSRNGQVIRISEPVLITYEKPPERVLFNSRRDCNPFALLYEGIYMLAGRNDVAPLAYYTKQFNEYSDDGKTLNGAYGYRWRHARPYHPDDQWGQDQLTVLINHLKHQPNSRRAVLQMWNVEDDLLKIGPDREDCSISVTSKDVCCNLSVMFSIRTENNPRGEPEPYRVGDEIRQPPRFLDVTVTNRSNDLVWGLLGANYVTFSVLQEYVAAHLGVQVGKYHHFTNNLHVYDWNWKPELWLADGVPDYYTRAESFDRAEPRVPLVTDPTRFDKELNDFVELHKTHNLSEVPERVQRLWTKWEEPFFRYVAQPLFAAHHWYKGIRDGSRRNEGDVEDALSNCQSWDWRMAGEAWMDRRAKHWRGVGK